MENILNQLLSKSNTCNCLVCTVKATPEEKINDVIEKTNKPEFTAVFDAIKSGGFIPSAVDACNPLENWTIEQFTAVILSMAIYNRVGALNNLTSTYRRKTNTFTSDEKKILRTYISTMPQVTAVFLDTLMVEMGLRFTDNDALRAIKVKNLDSLQWMYQNGDGVKLTTGDAVLCIKSGWLDGLKFIVENGNIVVPNAKLFRLYNEIDIHTTNEEDQYNCISWLFDHHAVHMTLAEIEAEIVAPSYKTKWLNLIPKKYFVDEDTRRAASTDKKTEEKTETDNQTNPQN
jgi:hypothetical protein